jgi:DNA-binding MarR family transcriptional regulator
MTDYYEEHGVLVLGSRLRRMSERMLAEIAGIYKSKGIEFEPGWFHVLYLLNENKEMSIMEISEKLSMSHPSVIQVSRVMEKNNVVKAFPGKKDKRKRTLKLTTKGKKLLEEIIPIWSEIRTAITDLLNEGEHSKVLLQAITELEVNLNKQALLERI